LTVLLVLAENVPPTPAYTAVIGCVATLSDDVVKVAVVTPAVVVNVPVPMLPPLSLKVTVPVGVPVVADTVAVKVTD